MKSTKRDRSKVDILFLLALFGVFLISALFIVLFGARIYKKTANDMETNFNARTSVSYITEKIHRNDIAGGVAIANTDGSDMLMLRQFTDYGTYVTYLYLSDGYLREITLSENAPLEKSAGAKILALNDFSIEEINASLLEFYMTDASDTPTTFFVSINAKGGVVHE